MQLDFNQNTDYIERNAEVLITLIQDMNTRMQGHSTHEIVVMGTSMGAIITRYALALMETRNIDHNVRLMISHDGPNSGANIPWGLQTLIDGVSFGLIPTLYTGYNLLNLLENGVNPNSVLPGFHAPVQLMKQSPFLVANLNRYAFESNLSYAGNYPSQCRKIAIANGANDGQGHKSLGVQLMDFHKEGSGSSVLATFPLLGNLTSYAGYSLDLNVYAGEYLGSIVSSSYAIAYAGISIFGIALAPSVSTSSIGFNFSSGLWDVAPGGKMKVSSLDLEYFTFIPTVSALDLNTSNPYYDVSSITNFGSLSVPDAGGFKLMPNTAYTYANNITPFDAIWADDDNSFHSSLENSYKFILQEASPTTLVVQNRTINKDVTFEALDKVIIGRDESAAFPIGNVIVTNGTNVKTFAGETIELQGEISFPLGVEVELSLKSYTCH